jgi:NAD(P)-dependent dehydrogenase (short-subunit alcohol dehydrogenase family)
MFTAGEPVLAGQGAVVTGAACGIGRAIAAALAAAGARVLAADIAQDRLAATAEELGVNCAPVDVTSKDSVAQLRDQARSQLGAATPFCRSTSPSGTVRSPSTRAVCSSARRRLAETWRSAELGAS